MPEPQSANTFMVNDAAFIRQAGIQNIQQLATLLSGLMNQSGAERMAVSRGVQLRGDLESALQGTGALRTGLGRVAASSARGATNLALSQQRTQMAQAIAQLATQGGLGMLGQQVGAFQTQLGLPEKPGVFSQIMQGIGGILGGAGIAKSAFASPAGQAAGGAQAGFDTAQAMNILNSIPMLPI